ncbi:MAG: cysteine hydrolase [Lachnospiraceae bacterium]|nr:cysteine hydrolase [Lachnospiraceae bacterium]
MKVLIVVDMQNDFIDGALGTKEAAAIVENVKDKIHQYKMENHLVLFTRDTHESDYLKTREGKYLPVVHCIRGSKGWQIKDGLTVQEDMIVDKPTFGSFDLVDQIRAFTKESQIEAIELVGLCTDICVISNAMICKAAFPEVDILVDGKCCAGVTPESHQIALKAMEMCQIIIL